VGDETDAADLGENLMRVVPAGLLSLLNNAPVELLCADLYTFTLLNGSVYRWTDFDADVKVSANTWLHSGPVIKRSAMKWSRGLSVEAMDMKLADDGVDGPPTMIGNVPLIQAFAQRAFDGATVQLDRMFSNPGTPSWQGPITMFLGRVGEIKSAGRSQIEFSVNCMLDILNQNMPRNLFQPSCRWTLFDAGCTLNPASFSVSGTVASGSSAGAIKAALAAATGYYNLGRIVFTSGVNNGVTRSIKTYTNGSPSIVILSVPLPVTPGVGDAFTIYAGCDKTQATCTSRFSNITNYGGEPFIPSPETAI
jgi:uncharacterized phage protein (TIGR02218 family)